MTSQNTHPRLSTWLIAMTIGSFIPVAHAEKSSISCKKAHTPVEHAICGSDTLSKIDHDLAHTYEMLKQAFIRASEADMKHPADDISTIVQQQRKWLRLRERSCNKSDDIDGCVQTITQQRLAALGGGVDPTSLAGRFEPADKTSKFMIFPVDDAYIARIQSAGCSIKAKIIIDKDNLFRFVSADGNAFFLLINNRLGRASPELGVRSIGAGSSGHDGVRFINQLSCWDGDGIRSSYIRSTYNLP